MKTIDLEESGIKPGLFGAAACLLAYASHLYNGAFTPLAIKLVLATVIVAIVGACLKRSAAMSHVGGAVLLLASVVTFAGNVSAPFFVGFHIKGVLDLLGFIAPVAAAGVVCGALWTARGKTAVVLMGLVLACYLYAGIWVLRHMPIPPIDVYIFQVDSVEALRSGINPYDIVFRDPYSPEGSAKVYGSGVSVNGILQFGYPYLPLTLLAAVPFDLAGDVRYLYLFSMMVAACLIAAARPGPVSRVAAVLYLFNPQFAHVLSQSWTEPFSVLMLAAVYFCYYRLPRVLPFAVGLLLASKQYMIVAVPLLLMLVERPWTRRSLGISAAKAGLIAAIVTLPLALWDLAAFLHSAVLLQFRQPFRTDALSFLVWARPSEPDHWMWLPFAVAGLAIAGCWYLARRGRIGFAGSFALTLLVFFAFNKQAFANYYHLVIGALCCAIGESLPAKLEQSSHPKAAQPNAV